MSKPMSAHEGEDVLSSIRRLVADVREPVVPEMSGDAQGDGSEGRLSRLEAASTLPAPGSRPEPLVLERLVAELSQPLPEDLLPEIRRTGMRDEAALPEAAAPDAPLVEQAASEAPAVAPTPFLLTPLLRVVDPPETAVAPLVLAPAARAEAAPGRGDDDEAVDATVEEGFTLPAAAMPEVTVELDAAARLEARAGVMAAMALALPNQRDGEPEAETAPEQVSDRTAEPWSQTTVADAEVAQPEEAGTEPPPSLVQDASEPQPDAAAAPREARLPILTLGELPLELPAPEGPGLDADLSPAPDFGPAPDFVMTAQPELRRMVERIYQRDQRDAPAARPAPLMLVPSPPQPTLDLAEDDLLWAAPGTSDVVDEGLIDEPSASTAPILPLLEGHWAAERLPRSDWQDDEAAWSEAAPPPERAPDLQAEPLARAWAEVAEREIKAELGRLSEDDLASSLGAALAASDLPPEAAPQPQLQAQPLAWQPPAPPAEAPLETLIDLQAEPQDLILDEETLREMVREILRAELAGALGERITRNVRKLVRGEIARALAMRDLD